MLIHTLNFCLKLIVNYQRRPQDEKIITTNLLSDIALDNTDQFSPTTLEKVVKTLVQTAQSSSSLGLKIVSTSRLFEFLSRFAITNQPQTETVFQSLLDLFKEAQKSFEMKETMLLSFVTFFHEQG